MIICLCLILAECMHAEMRFYLSAVSEHLCHGASACDGLTMLMERKVLPVFCCNCQSCQSPMPEAAGQAAWSRWDPMHAGMT